MGGNKTTTTASSSPPAYDLSALNNTIAQAQNLYNNNPNYVPYSGTTVAPTTAEQNTGIANTNAYAFAAQPDLTWAGDTLQKAGGPLTQAQIQEYMNPYTADVVNATQNQFNLQNAIQQQGVTGNAIAQGALGGNRSAVAAAETANLQQTAQAPVIAGLENTAYNTGLTTAEQQFQANPEAAAYGVANVGQAKEATGLTGANAQIGAGTLQQQYAAAPGTAPTAAQVAYNLAEYQAAQAYPYQALAAEEGFITAPTSLSGGTSQTTAPPPNVFSQIAGLGVGALGLGALMGGSGRTAGSRGGRMNVADGGGVSNRSYSVPEEVLAHLIHRAWGGAAGGSPGGVANMPYGGGSALSYIPAEQSTHGSGPPRPPGAPQQTSLSQQMQQISMLAKGLGGGGSGSGTLGTAVGKIGGDSFGDQLDDSISDLGDWRGGGISNRRHYAKGGGDDDAYDPADSILPDSEPTFSARALREPVDPVYPTLVKPTHEPPPDTDSLAPAPLDRGPPLPRPRPRAADGLAPTGASPRDAEGNEVVDTHEAGVAAPPAPEAPKLRESPLSPRDRDRVIKTVYGEAGNQLPVGQAAVAHVIQNRLHSGVYGDSPSSVVTAPYQFEPWNTQEGRSRMNTMPPRDYEAIGKIVDKTFRGEIPDPTGGATHFFAPGAQAALGRAVPEWGRGQGLRIGDHLFFNPGGKLSPPEGSGSYDVASLDGVAAPSGARRTKTSSDEEPPPPVHGGAPDGVAPPSHKGLFGLSPEVATALAAAGFGMAAGSSPYAGANIGLGGLTGMQTYSNEMAQERAGKLSQNKIEMESKKLDLAAARETRAQAHATKMEEFAEERLHRPIAIEDEDGKKTLYDPVTKKPLISQPTPPPSAPARPATTAGAPPPPGTPPAAPGAPQPPTASPTGTQVADASGSVLSTVTGNEDTTAPLANVQKQDDNLADRPGTHPEALDDMNPHDAAEVRAMAQGRKKFLSQSRTNPHNNMLMRKLFEYDPGADETDFARRGRTANFFAVGTQGGGGQQVVSMNRFIGHSANLLRIAEKLGMGDYTTLNDVKIELAKRGLWNRETQDLLGQWEVNAKGVGDEAAKTFAGNNPALADRSSWHEVLNPNTPLHTIRAKISTAAGMAGTALDAMTQQYNEGMKTNHSSREFLTPGTRKIFEALQSGKTMGDLEKETKGGGAPAGGGAGPVRVQTPADAQKLSPGTHYITPDNKEYTR